MGGEKLTHHSMKLPIAMATNFLPKILRAAFPSPMALLLYCGTLVELSRQDSPPWSRVEPVSFDLIPSSLLASSFSPCSSARLPSLLSPGFSFNASLSESGLEETLQADLLFQRRAFRHRFVALA